MKKFLALLVAITCLCFNSVEAQTPVNASQVVYAGGSVSDTIIKNGIKYYTYFAKSNLGQSTYFEGISFNVKATRQSGNYTKIRYVLQKSFDYSKWYAVDSIAIASTTTPYTTILEFKNVYAPYYRIKAYAYDSTQKVKNEFYILTELK